MTIPSTLFRYTLTLLLLSGYYRMPAQETAYSAIRQGNVRTISQSGTSSLQKVLNEIKERYNVSFLYQKKNVTGKTVRGDIHYDHPLAQLLTEILSPLELAFEKKNQSTYVIYPDATRKSNKKAGTGISLWPDTITIAVLSRADLKVEEDQVYIAINGRVTDEKGLPLSEVSVQEKGRSNGTTTDARGNFSLSVKGLNSILVFSYIGYALQEVPLNGNSAITVKMVPMVQAGEEVVVIGYGNQKRKDLTGSVSTLNASSYKDQPVLTPSAALQGRVAGVAVTNNSGAPGGAVKIRIRGANSVNANNDPLYVVDGIALSSIGLQDLNVNDIESMEVLKDASATAIYGSRGANGVIIITTKSGKAGVSKVDYNGFVSFNRPMKKYELMDPVTYAKMANLTAGVNVFANPNSFAGKGTDWQHLLFSDAITQNHQLSLTGGTEKAKYYISGFYIDQQGLLINSDQKRFGLRTNIDARVSDKISVGFGLYAGRINSFNNNDMGYKGNPVMSAVTWAPTEPVYADPAKKQYKRTGISPIWTNPYMNIVEKDNENFSNVGVFNGRIKYAITDWLTLNVNAGLDMYISRYAYLNNDWISPGNMGSGQSSSESYTFQNSDILTFHKAFAGRHDLTATAVWENTSNKSSSFNATGSNLTSITNGYYNLGLNAGQSISSGYSNWALLSYMGRIAYSLDNKYLLTATVRRDGSSKFQGNNKWSTFPSAGVGWKLLEEPFIRQLSFFSNLKLRAGWGMTGNQAIGPYSTLGLLNQVLYSYGAGSNYQGYTAGNPATPDVKWETSRQTDVGLDIGLFNGCMNITADYYSKNTSDLLLFTRIANYDGGGSLLKNTGKVNNKGFELMIEASPLKNSIVAWTTSINISTNKNKVINLGRDSILFRDYIGNGLINTNIQAVKVGEPLGAFYLIPWTGVYQAKDDNLGYNPGDNRYTDVSGNGSIGYEDRVIAGTATPVFQWGFNNNLSYGNFELNVFIQGSHGNKVFNATYAAAAVPSSDVYYPTLAEAANYWTPQNTATSWANPGSKSNRNYIESTHFLQDGSYVRLKNISLSYTLPRSMLKLGSARISVSAQNMITITKYKGYDPEASTTSSGSDADAGIDLGAYPSPKTITIALHLAL